jgi:hypothetical protein
MSFKKVKIKVYKIMIFCIFLMGMKPGLWHRILAFENREQGTIFGNKWVEVT